MIGYPPDAFPWAAAVGEAHRLKLEARRLQTSIAGVEP
jgi:hypothetical protein